MSVTPATNSAPMPNPNARKRRSTYPFDDLVEPGMSFGVVGKTAKALSNAVGNQNRKYSGERHFFARDVDETTDPDGASVRVWRDV